MPQGWIAKVEKDYGYVSSRKDPDDATAQPPKRFRHWALAAEMGGRFPPVGAYVQYREVHDPQRGDYITEIRQLTPPQVLLGRNQNVYVQPESPVEPGVFRLVDGKEGPRVPLEEALRQESDQAQAQSRAGIREVTRPVGPLHPVVDTEWTLPATSPAPAPQASARVDNVFDDGHTVTVTVETTTQESLPGGMAATETT